ncbi:hypothetical protein Tco_0171924 [Tanacetum coccineum]
MNLEPLMRDGGGQEEVNGNGGNGNKGNRNIGNGNGGNRNGVVRLTRWFKKMETVFHISNCPEKYQVKTYEVDGRSVLSKKRGLEDGDRVVEPDCEGK